MWFAQTYRTIAFSLYGALNFTKSAFIKHAEHFNKADTEVDLKGKTCIVTGANSGLGLAAAQELASKRATVFIVCRNKEKGEQAIADIKSKTGNDDVHLEVCDLSSPKDVKNLASKFVQNDQPLYALVDTLILRMFVMNFIFQINNAGLMEHERRLTEDGREVNFAVNVAGTYTLTELLIPALQKAAPESRVVTVSSGGMYGSPLSDDLQYSEGKFNGVSQYARNKRLQVAMTERWANIYGERGINFYAMHPGWADTPGVTKSLPEFNKRFEGKLRTPEQGSDTVVWLAVQPNDRLRNGGFYFDRSEAPKHLATCGTGYTREQAERVISRVREICFPAGKE